MTGAKFAVLLSGAEIASRVGELAQRISEDYRGKKILLVCVLKGAVVFASDLMRRLQVPVEIDFIAVSSYGVDTATSGVVRILKDLDQSIQGKDVLVVEDIVDTGLTLSYLRENLLSRQPRSLKVVTLLDKPARRLVAFNPDYCGFAIPDRFVIGYGLDYNEDYRQLADLCIYSEARRQKSGVRMRKPEKTTGVRSKESE
jgi:hypoxanthine phosphoribosyltransferase